jgi:hypothetical protein
MTAWGRAWFERRSLAATEWTHGSLSPSMGGCCRKVAKAFPAAAPPARRRTRSAVGGGGGSAGQAAAVALVWRHSLRRLCVAVMSRHSKRQAAWPRR